MKRYQRFFALFLAVLLLGTSPAVTSHASQGGDLPGKGQAPVLTNESTPPQPGEGAEDAGQMPGQSQGEAGQTPGQSPEDGTGETPAPGEDTGEAPVPGEGTGETPAPGDGTGETPAPGDGSGTEETLVPGEEAVPEETPAGEAETEAVPDDLLIEEEETEVVTEEALDAGAETDGIWDPTADEAYVTGGTDIGIDLRWALFRQEGSGEAYRLEIRVTNPEREKASIEFKWDQPWSLVEERDKITEVYIGSRIQSLSAYTFKGLAGLKKVRFQDIEENTPRTGYRDEMWFYNGVFEGCSSLEELQLPWNAYMPNDYGYFKGCTNLKKLTIEEPPAGRHAYLGVEDGVLYAGEEEGPWTEKTRVLYCLPSRTEPSYVMPDTVKMIYEHAFADNRYLKHVTGGAALEWVGIGAFTETNLESVTFTGDRLRGIRMDVFNGCERLKTVELPREKERETLEVIWDRAFYGCTSLETINLPDTVRTIKREAFYNCTSLKEIHLGSALDMIENWAFENCTSLTELTVPGGVKEFSTYMIMGCSSISTLTLSEGVEIISGFSRLRSLKTVYLPVSLTRIRRDTFFDKEYPVETVYYAGSKRMWNGVTVEEGNENLTNGKITLILSGEEPDALYTVTFSANGGEGEIEPLPCKPDESITLPESGFTRYGYVFLGWNETSYHETGKAVKYKPGAVLKNPGNRTLYAAWEPLSFTIRYHGNGATEGSLADEKVTFPEGFEKELPMAGAWRLYKREGFRFDGFSTKQDGKAQGAVAVKTPADLIDIAQHGRICTLYAQWEAVPFKVRYSTDPPIGWLPGILLAEDTPREYLPTEATPVPAPKPVYRTWTWDDMRYSFDGWYADQSYKKSMNTIPKGTKGDVILYPKYTLKKVTVHFLANADGPVFDPVAQETCGLSDTKVTGSVKPMTTTGDNEIVLPVCTFKRKGYLFAGWAKEPAKGWAEKTKMGVTLHPESAELPELYAPGERLLPYGITTKYAPQETLYAVWVPDDTQRKIVFHATDGTLPESALSHVKDYAQTEIAESNTEVAIALPAGKKIAAKQMPVPELPGYDFTGWYRGSTLVKKVTALPVSDNDYELHLYAGWKARTFTVKYTGGKGKYITGSVKAEKYVTGDTVRLPWHDVILRRGYSPDRDMTWKLQGTDQTYEYWSRLTLVPSQNNQVFTFEVNWVPQEYTIIFDPGWHGFLPGGSIDKLENAVYNDKSFRISRGNYYFDSTLKGFKLPVPETERSDYRFSHWIDEKTKKKVTSLNAGTLAENITLEAVWKPVRKMTILFHEAWDRNSNTAAVTAKESAKIRLRTKPVGKVPEGMVFVGWERGNEDGDPLSESPPAGNGLLKLPAARNMKYPGESITVDRTRYHIRDAGYSTHYKDDLTEIHYYPVYAKAFEITLDPGQGAFKDGQTEPRPFTYSANAGVPKSLLFDDPPVREGYDFAGWSYFDGSKNKTVTVTGALGKNLNRCIAMEAVWKPKKMTVVFYHNIPKNDPCYKRVRGSMRKQTLYYGTQTYLNKNAFRLPGYTFDGWQTEEGNTFGGGNVVYHDNNLLYAQYSSKSPVYEPEIKLYARWKKESYSITYTDRDPVTGSNYVRFPFDQYSYTTDTVPSRYDVDTPTFKLVEPVKSGYVFQGWYKDPKFRTRITQVKQGSTGDLTLYAKWKKL